MKRKIAILMSAMMVASAMPMTASAAAFNDGKVVATAFSKANYPIDANAEKYVDGVPTYITPQDLEERQSMLILEFDEKDLTGPIPAGTTFSIKLENGTFDRKYEDSFQYINSVNGRSVTLSQLNTSSDLTTFFNSFATANTQGSNNVSGLPISNFDSGSGVTGAVSFSSVTGSEVVAGMEKVRAHVNVPGNTVTESSNQYVIVNGNKIDVTQGSEQQLVNVYNAVNETNYTKQDIFNILTNEVNAQAGIIAGDSSNNAFIKEYLPYEFQIVSATEAKVTIPVEITNSDNKKFQISQSNKTPGTVTDIALSNGSSEVTKFDISGLKSITGIALRGTQPGTSSSTNLNLVNNPYLAIPLGGVVADTDGPIKATVTGDYTEKIKTKEFSLTKNEASSTKFDYPEKNIKYFEDYAKLEPIVIKESSRLTIGRSDDKDVAKVSLRLGTGFRFKGTQANLVSNLEVRNDAKPDQVIPHSNVALSDNGSLLTFDLDLSGVDRSNPMGLRIGVKDNRGGVEGLSVEYINERQFGEVSMTVSGDGINSETKTVAKRETFGFDLKTMKDPQEIIAGRHYTPNNTNSQGTVTNGGTMVEADNTTVEIQFSEKIPNTLVESRALDFTVPEGVKIVDAYIDYSSVRHITGLENADFEIINNGKTLRLKRDTYNVTNSNSINNLASFRFKLDLSVDPAFSGDIKLAVTGGGESDATETVVAKAVTPFTLETSTTKVNMGYQDYNTADITITEAKPGMFLDGKDVILELRAPFGETDLGFSAAQFETTGSELNIKPADFKVKNGKITFNIDRASSKEPASIKIKNVKVGTNRSVPYGAYDLAFYGDAVINNYDEKVDDSKSQPINQGTSKLQPLYDQNNTDHFKFATYVDLVTETGTFDKTVKVSVGEKTVLVGDQAVDMDVAPYIQASSNSTMVPLRFVSVALGVDTANVSNPDASSKIAWDANTKTTTIYYGAGTGQKIIQFQAGSNIMTVDGTRIPMEYGVKAEIKDGRMFVPFRALGQALGVTVDWDPDTRTAIYNKDHARNTNIAATTATETTTESTTATTTETTTESTTASDSTTETTTAKK